MPYRWRCEYSALASRSDTSIDSSAPTDAGTSLAISRTLFFGLLLSVAIMILGLVLVLPEGKNAATRVVSLDRVLPDLVHGSRPALLDFGILVLFATPLLGVVVAFLQFIRGGDRAFTLITALLLVVLAAGFLVALH
jgi:uncharacterized membrane protein